MGPVFGSNENDQLQALPQDVTLSTPDSTLKMLGFERVDAYARGSYDYGQAYGSNDDDVYYPFDTYQVLQGDRVYSGRKGLNVLMPTAGREMASCLYSPTIPRCKRIAITHALKARVHSIRC